MCIEKLRLDLVLMAQDMRGFRTRQAESRDRHRELQRIERECSRASHALFAKREESRRRIHLAPKFPREPHGAGKMRRARLCHLQAGDVEGRQQQVVRARRCQEAHRPLHALFFDAPFAEQQERSLRHRAEELVRALRDEIGARCDRRLRQIFRESEMRAVRLVDEECHARLVHDLGDGTHVGGDAVIRRRNEQQRLRLRMQAARLAHRLRTKPVRYAERLVNDRLNVDGMRIGKHEATENGAMHIARHKHGVARRERGHKHRMDRARRAVDGEKGRIRSIKRGGEILRLLDAARRLVQIVKLFHQRDLFSKACFRHKLA